MRVFPSLRKMFLAIVIAAVPAASFAGVFVSVSIAPPVLPVYVQPVCPTAGYLWTPGYWAYGAGGYYWVPGVWVEPPGVGLLWTPGYWGWGNGLYAWHAGYWGPRVGFYGGVNYGFGYGGVGFVGGGWRGGHFFYNTAVVHVNTTIIHNTYVDRTVINNHVGYSRASFNGPGGINARPTSAEIQASHQQRFGATSNQMVHQEHASTNRAQFYSQNHGNPAVAARSEVGARASNQQGRIAAGENHGQINAGEASRDEARQSRIDNSVHNDREANGGRLTGQEKQNINRRQNNAGKQIHNQKHEGDHGHR